MPGEHTALPGITVKDDNLLRIGTSGWGVITPRSTSLAANQTLTGVFVGTPVVQALAANTIIVSNTTENGDVVVAVNNGGNSVEALHIDASGLVVTLGHGGFTITVPAVTTFAGNGIGATPTDRLILSNTTAAALGAQQYSPASRWDSKGWETTGGTSQTASWRQYVVPVQGATLTSYLGWDASINDGAFTNRLRLTSGGMLQITQGNGIDWSLNGSTSTHLVSGTGVDSNKLELQAYDTLTLQTYTGQGKPIILLPDTSAVLVNATTAYGTLNQQLEINEAAASEYGGIALHNWSATASFYSTLAFHRAKSGAVGTYTAAVTGEPLGAIYFYGADGTNWQQAAYLNVLATGTIGANRVPGSWVFHAYTDAASSVDTTVLTMTAAAITLGAPLSGAGAHALSSIAGVNLTGGFNYQVNGVDVLGGRMIDVRIDDTPNSGDATTDGIIAALQSMAQTHGMMKAA